MSCFMTKRIRLILWLVGSALLLPALTMRASDTLSVERLGLYPDTYGNCVAKVREVLDLCRQKGYGVLRFEEGRYDFWPEGASRRDIFVSNTSSETECPSKRSEEHTSELQSRQYLVCRL